MTSGLNPVLAKMIQNVYRNKEDIPHYELVANCESAQVYKRDKSKMWIYVIRGWKLPKHYDEIPDAKALIDSTIASRPRYKQVKACFQKHPAPPGYRLLATGHSMGGAYADQLIEDGIVKEAITFNPAIQLKDLNNTGNTRYYNRNDFLYKIIGMHASNVHTINNTFFDKVDYAIGFLNLLKSYFAHKIEEFIPKKEEPKHETIKEGTQKDYLIQSVHLSKDYFEDVEHAKRWMAEHNYIHKDMDETPNEYRFRQMSPKLVETGHYKPKSVKIGDAGYLIVLYK